MAIIAIKNNVAKKPQISVHESYCRMCNKVLPSSKFYETTNPMIDKNGLMSVCKDHCAEIYDTYFSIHNNLEIALQLTCEALDVCFNQEALRQTKSHIEKLLSSGKKAEAVFGYYKSKLMSTGKNNDSIEDFRYKDSDFENNTNQLSKFSTIDNVVLSDSDFELTEEIIKHWGKGKDNWEYEFLEEEIYRLKTDFECPDYGMEMIMKDICFINLDIERIRQGLDKGDITKLIESRSKLMNDGNLKPVQSTGADKNEKLSLGVFIKKWENERPVTKKLDDEMKRYIDTFMVGHLAKMEGLNNELVKQYEDAIADYTINLSDVKSEEFED